MNTCAIVPAYKVSAHLPQVVLDLAEFVDHIFVVDDCCPESSGKLLLEEMTELSNLSVIFHDRNHGVGGAMVTGYREAKAEGYDIAIKVDGDGQMNPHHIPSLIAPIIAGEADYTKGNRFFDPHYLERMPKKRMWGNAALSFISKLSTGHWHVMDPTNGFTAIHLGIINWIQLDRIEERYFFETDLLFRLGTIEAVVQDIPMPSVYGNEKSNLSVRSSLFEFSGKHMKLFFKRMLYTYFLRGFHMASVFLVVSIPFMLFGFTYGISAWSHSIETGKAATAGTIMLAALPAVFGVQLLLGFLSFDMGKRPLKALWKRLGK